ncbi:MAG: iron chaperone [Gaiellaceae bacterium]
MSAEEVDEYLRGVDEPKRSTLRALRRTILEIAPDAEQVISYRVPAFGVRDKTVAGFAAYRNHLSYLPFSGSVLPALAHELEGYTMTKGALHFPVDRPLPKTLVKKLISARLGEAPRPSR